MLPVGAAYVIHRIYGAPHTRGTLCAAYMIVAYVSDAPHTRRLHGLGPWRRAGHCLAASADVAPPPWPVPVTPYIGVTYIRPNSASPIEPAEAAAPGNGGVASGTTPRLHRPGNGAGPASGRASISPGTRRAFARYAARSRPVRGALSPGFARYAARSRPVRGALSPGARRRVCALLRRGNQPAAGVARVRLAQGVPLLCVCAPCAGGP